MSAKPKQKTDIEQNLPAWKQYHLTGHLLIFMFKIVHTNVVIDLMLELGIKETWNHNQELLQAINFIRNNNYMK